MFIWTHFFTLSCRASIKYENGATGSCFISFGLTQPLPPKITVYGEKGVLKGSAFEMQNLVSSLIIVGGGELEITEQIEKRSVHTTFKMDKDFELDPVID